MVFVYDSAKVTLLEKIGEIAFPVAVCSANKHVAAGIDFRLTRDDFGRHWASD